MSIQQGRRDALASNKAKFTEWTVVLAGTLSVIVGAFSVIPDWQRIFTAPRHEEAESVPIRAELDALKRELISVKRDQGSLLTSLRGAAPETRLLADRLRLVEQREHKLEQIILSDPAKALELPLLKRDIDNVRESNAQALEAVRRSVEQTYDLSKWLLGALALGVLSLAVNSFLSKRSKGLVAE
jgi:hypothetical protein